MAAPYIIVGVGGITLVGLVLVLFWIRPMLEKQAREEAAA